MRRHLLVLLAAVLAVPACAGRGEARQEELPPSTVPYFAGRTAMFPGGTEHTLARSPLPRLRGVDGPAAVGVAAGPIVYSTYEEKVRLDPALTPQEQGIRDDTVLGRLSVRVADDSGDRQLVAGGFAPAVSTTGRVAVGLFDHPDQRYGDEHDAAIAVLEPGATAPTRWTGADGLRTPVAWAGDTLVYAVPVALKTPALWLTTGPGTDRQLVPAGYFVAVSPDREQVLVAVQEPDRDGRLAIEARSTRDGRLLSRVATDLSWIGRGSWTAQGILAVGAPEPGVLTALDLGDDLRQRRKVDFRVPVELAAPPNEVAMAPDHRSFGVVTFVAGTTAANLTWALLGCSLDDGACGRTDLRHGTEFVGFVSNPSP